MLAAELEIRPELLYRWRREFHESPVASFAGHGNPGQTEEETQLERDILKKAI